MSQANSEKDVFYYLSSADTSIGEAKQDAKSLDAWHWPNIPGGFYSPRQDTYD